MPSMLPLLLVALLVWAGVFAFIFAVDRRVRDLERRVSARQTPEETRR
jgi:CcmD family protein